MKEEDKKDVKHLHSFLLNRPFVPIKINKDFDRLQQIATRLKEGASKLNKCKTLIKKQQNKEEDDQY